MEDQLRASKQNSILKGIRFEDKDKKYVLEAINKSPVKPKGSYWNKIAFSAAAFAALVLLVVGGSYVSPAMAKVAAGIPYISQFSKEQKVKFDISDTIYQVSRDHGYKFRDADLNVEQKKIAYYIAGTNSEINQQENEIEQTLDTALKRKDLGHFEITVKKYNVKPQDQRIPETTADDEKFMKQSDDLKKRVIEELRKNHYVTVFPVEVRVKKVQNFMYVSVPNTETRMDELKSMLRSVSKDYGEFKMRITRIDMKAREQEVRWGEHQIIPTIGEALMADKSLKVRTYSFSFHPYPLQLKIKTNIQSTDPDAAFLAKKIETEIKEYIQFDENTKDIRKDPYILTVLSKDKKKIN